MASWIKAIAFFLALSFSAKWYEEEFERFFRVRCSDRTRIFFLVFAFSDHKVSVLTLISQALNIFTFLVFIFANIADIDFLKPVINMHIYDILLLFNLVVMTILRVVDVVIGELQTRSKR
jgi:hypothetical protein